MHCQLSYDESLTVVCFCPHSSLIYMCNKNRYIINFFWGICVTYICKHSEANSNIQTTKPSKFHTLYSFPKLHNKEIQLHVFRLQSSQLWHCVVMYVAATNLLSSYWVLMVAEIQKITVGKQTHVPVFPVYHSYWPKLSDVTSESFALPTCIQLPTYKQYFAYSVQTFL
jgi:hypothetical protein